MSSLFKSKSILSEVGGAPVNFYSLSIPVIYALKSAVGPAAKLLSGFFRSTKLDVARISEKSIDEKGRPVEVVQAMPLSVEMAKLRASQSADTMKEVIETIFGDQNRLLLGRVLMDSLRDNCPRKPEPKQIEEFLEGLDFGILLEMLQGVVRANAEVFGPLGRQWAKLAGDQLRARASSESQTSDVIASSEEPVAPQPQGERPPAATV